MVIDMVCSLLLVIIKKIIASHDFIDLHRQNPTRFTRNRKFFAHSPIAFLLSLVRGSYQNELDRFFYILSRSDSPKRAVAKSASAKSRINIKLIFEALFELLTETIERIRPGRQYPRNHRVSARSTT